MGASRGSSRLVRVIGTAAAVLAWAARGEAQPEPAWDPPELAELVRIALSASPEVRAAASERAALEAREPRSRALPDPMVSATYVNDGISPSLGAEEMTMITVMASQELPYPGKRRLRAQLAERDVALAERSSERVRLAITGAVRRAYVRGVLADELVDLVRAQRVVLQDVEAAARLRYAAGEGSEAEVLRVQSEVTRLHQLHAHHGLEASLRQAELRRLLGGAVPPGSPAALELRPLQGSVEEWTAWSLENSPELQAAALQIERDREAVELARRERKPDFVAQAGYSNRGALDPMWEVGFGIRLPLYRAQKQDRAVVEAEANLEVSGHARDVLARDLTLLTEQRLAEMEAVARIVGVASGGLLPQDRLAADASLASYRAGRGPYVAVLDALSLQYADRADMLRQIARHEELRAELLEIGLASSGMAPGSGAGMPRRARMSGGPEIEGSGMGSMSSGP